eukprot:gene12378-biopygen13316
MHAVEAPSSRPRAHGVLRYPNKKKYSWGPKPVTPPAAATAQGGGRDRLHGEQLGRQQRDGFGTGDGKGARAAGEGARTPEGRDGAPSSAAAGRRAVA